jgi:hypothetical protein
MRTVSKLFFGVGLVVGLGCGAAQTTAPEHASPRPTAPAAVVTLDWREACGFQQDGEFMPRLSEAVAQVAAARSDAMLVFGGETRDAAAYRAWLDRWVYVEPPWVRLTADRVVLSEQAALAIVAQAATAGHPDTVTAALQLAGAPLDTPPRLALCWEAVESL